MDRTNILATYIFVLAERCGNESEYELEHIEIGKLYIPHKMRLKQISKQEIEAQFCDDPKWAYCESHNFHRAKNNPNCYKGKRCFKGSCQNLKITSNDNGESLIIHVAKHVR